MRDSGIGPVKNGLRALLRRAVRRVALLNLKVREFNQSASSGRRCRRSIEDRLGGFEFAVG